MDSASRSFTAGTGCRGQSLQGCHNWGIKTKNLSFFKLNFLVWDPWDLLEEGVLESRCSESCSRRGFCWGRPGPALASVRWTYSVRCPWCLSPALTVFGGRTGAPSHCRDKRGVKADQNMLTSSLKELRCLWNSCIYCHHPWNRSVTLTDTPVHCEKGRDIIISEQQKSGQPAFQKATVSMETCKTKRKNPQKGVSSFILITLFKYHHLCKV